MIHVVNIRYYGEIGEYIARPSSLGNPYSHVYSRIPCVRVATRREAVACYKQWLLGQVREDTPARRELWRLVHKYLKDGELTLACWCKPKLCHGDVLKAIIERLANLLKGHRDPRPTP